MELIIAVGAFITLVGAIPILVKWLSVTARFVARNIFHADLSIGVVEPPQGRQRFKAKLKVAYGGKASSIIEDMRVVANLRFLRRWEALAAWTQIIVGYLTYDLEGIRTVTGVRFKPFHYPQIHMWRGPRIFNQSLAIFYGVFMIYMLLLMLAFPPIGWLILLSGPYGRFRLMAQGDLIIIRQPQKETPLNKPILLKGDSETEYLIEYEFRLKAPGFLPDTRICRVSQRPHYTPWRLPHKGQFVWSAEESVELRVKNRWRCYPVNLGISLVRIL